MDIPAGTPPERHMGPVEVVAPATYPQDQFEANLPKWREVMASGRKTSDQIIAMAETKHPLTDEQKTAIRAPAAAVQVKADTGEIVMTFAQVAAKLNAAKDLDKLAEAASLISTVADSAQRGELTAMYEIRAIALPAATPGNNHANS